MSTLDDYSRQSPYSDPGEYAELFDPLPTDVPALAAVTRNLIVHFRASGFEFTGDRLAEIDHRWVARILATDQRRFGAPLDAPRPEPERVAGCCRDFTLLTVAALRHHGVPARSRVGFAGYFLPDFHCDHVVTEYWDGHRWVYTDTQLVPGAHWSFDPGDLPSPIGTDPPFASAARVWTAYRRGEIDAQRYGVAPELPLRGDWFLRNYVIQELAHRQREELLLWDGWGAMSLQLDGDLDLIDEIAALLLAADGGDEGAERELAARYSADPRLHPTGQVECYSPTGSITQVDLHQ